MQSLDQQPTGAKKNERQRKIDKDELIKRLKNGDAIPDIANDFDCTPEAIYNYLRRTGKGKRFTIAIIRKQENEHNQKIKKMLGEVFKLDWENNWEEAVNYFKTNLKEFFFYFKGGLGNE